MRARTGEQSKLMNGFAVGFAILFVSCLAVMLLGGVIWFLIFLFG